METTEEKRLTFEDRVIQALSIKDEMDKLFYDFESKWYTQTYEFILETKDGKPLVKAFVDLCIIGEKPHSVEEVQITRNDSQFTDEQIESYIRILGINWRDSKRELIQQIADAYGTT